MKQKFTRAVLEERFYDADCAAVYLFRIYQRNNNWQEQAKIGRTLVEYADGQFSNLQCPIWHKTWCNRICDYADALWNIGSKNQALDVLTNAVSQESDILRELLEMPPVSPLQRPTAHIDDDSEVPDPVFSYEWQTHRYAHNLLYIGVTLISKLVEHAQRIGEAFLLATVVRGIVKYLPANSTSPEIVEMSETIGSLMDEAQRRYDIPPDDISSLFERGVAPPRDPLAMQEDMAVEGLRGDATPRIQYFKRSPAISTFDQKVKGTQKCTMVNEVTLEEKVKRPVSPSVEDADEARMFFLYRVISQHAEVYVKLGQHQAALECRQDNIRLLSMYAKRRAEEYEERLAHPSLIRIRFLVAAEFLLIDKTAQALSIARSALRDAERVLSSNHVELGEFYKKTAFICIQNHQSTFVSALLNEALTYAQQAVVIFEGFFGRDSLRLTFALQLVAIILRRLLCVRDTAQLRAETQTCYKRIVEIYFKNKSSPDLVADAIHVHWGFLCSLSSRSDEEEQKFTSLAKLESSLRARHLDEDKKVA